MATTKAPLFGLDASGSFAGAIVFSKWRGRTYVRRLSIPANPRSILQRGMRSVFKFITQDYTNLTAAQKSSWSTLAAPDNITLLNAQVRDAQTKARVNTGWRRDTVTAPITSPDQPTALTVTAQNKSLLISWTSPVVNAGDYSAAVYLRITTGLTGLIQELQLVVDVTTISVTVVNLTNGIEQFVVVRETTATGLLGTVSAEASGTPVA